jgi:uncharacterized protein
MAAWGPFRSSVAETLPPAFDSWFAARRPDIPLSGARAALELAAAGASVPFIARYRRDRTLGLDAGAVRRALEAGELFSKIVSRQAIILESIERHATLSAELRERVLATFDPDVLEDLYHPYRQQKKNRALVAREAGLGPLADWIWDCGHGSETPQEGQTLELWAFTFRNAEKGVPDAKSAIEGARDILVERLAGVPELRAYVRSAYLERGWLRATKTAKAKPQGRFESYFSFLEKVPALREPQNTHRYLAVRRGQAEDELQLALGGGPQDAEFEARLVAAFEAAACSVPDSPGAEVLRHAGRIALKNDVRTSIENEVHRILKDAADAAIVSAFAESVRRRLLAAPFGPRPVVGVDPDLRGGCRLAAVDAAGAFRGSEMVPFQTAEEKTSAGESLAKLVRDHAAAAVAVGDGAGGRELELVARAALRAAGLAVNVVLVSEAGASALATGEAARAELPEADAAVRAAVSIARRLQDPLAELVKLEPRLLGAGQHHHDVPHALLQRALDGVVEDSVAAVGVDLNTASRALIARVPGLTPALAAAIVEHRAANGPFRARRQLLEVPGLSATAFEQAAGFLRVKAGEHPLDDSAVHPERYAALEALAARHGKSAGELVGPGAALVRETQELDAEMGALTRADVALALEQAGKDPRPAFVPFTFREDLRALSDLKPGMLCPGLVTNVTSFGIFVDVGVHHDGLVHVSQLGGQPAREAQTPLQPGDRVEVRVLKVDLEKKQISLTTRPRPERKPAPARRTARRPEPRPASSPEGAAPAGPTPPQRRLPERKPGPRAERARPDRPRPDRPRPQPAATERPHAAAARGGSGRPPADKRPESRRPVFNNPFAVLAGLKVPPKGEKS